MTKGAWTCTSVPRNPKGKESNWSQTNPGEGFLVMFRFYGTEREFYDKNWKLDDFQELR